MSVVHDVHKLFLDGAGQNKGKLPGLVEYMVAGDCLVVPDLPVSMTFLDPVSFLGLVNSLDPVKFLVLLGFLLPVRFPAPLGSRLPVSSVVLVDSRVVVDPRVLVDSPVRGSGWHARQEALLLVKLCCLQRDRRILLSHIPRRPCFEQRKRSWNAKPFRGGQAVTYVLHLFLL